MHVEKCICDSNRYSLVTHKTSALGVQRGWRPVHVAAAGGHAKVLLTLLRARGTIDAQTEVYHSLLF